jgi:hypothetical protein
MAPSEGGSEGLAILDERKALSGPVLSDCLLMHPRRLWIFLEEFQGRSQKWTIRLSRSSKTQPSTRLPGSLKGVGRRL